VDVLPIFIGQRIVSKEVRIINPCLRGEQTATRDPVTAFPASIDNALNDIISFDYQQPVSMCRRPTAPNNDVVLGIRRLIMAHTCKRCGAVAKDPGHLCDPCGDRQKCSFCGAPDINQAHMCKSKLTAMKFVCDGCGRVAMESEHLCKPSPIG